MKLTSWYGQHSSHVSSTPLISIEINNARVYSFAGPYFCSAFLMKSRIISVFLTEIIDILAILVYEGN